MKVYLRSEFHRVNVKALLTVFLFLFFSFQKVFVQVISPLGYVDEVLVLFVLGEIIWRICKYDRIYKQEDVKVLVLMVILCAIGFAGNIYAKLISKPFAIMIDVLSIFKIFLMYYWALGRKMTRKDWDDTIILSAKIVRVLLLVMAAGYIAGLGVRSLGFFSKPRYGIPTYQFLFNNPGNFSKLFYYIIPLLSADLYYENNFKKRFFILLALGIWLTTIRSRAVAFVACYIIFAIWYFCLRGRSKKRISIINIVPLGCIGLILGWQQLLFYFTNETQARGQLLMGGICTMKTYFPFGSGFGTYGSDIASKYYSPLYYKYGFNEIYGMGRTHTNFLNDNYWPMIMGQFGMIGVIIVGVILYHLYKRMIKGVEGNMYFYFASLCATAFLLVSSIASKSYSEFNMIPIFMLQAALMQREESTE